LVRRAPPPWAARPARRGGGSPDLRAGGERRRAPTPRALLRAGPRRGPPRRGPTRRAPRRPARRGARALVTACAPMVRQELPHGRIATYTAASRSIASRARRESCKLSGQAHAARPFVPEEASMANYDIGKIARDWKDTPYLYGGDSHHGIDCSHF